MPITGIQCRLTFSLYPHSHPRTPSPTFSEVGGYSRHFPPCYMDEESVGTDGVTQITQLVKEPGRHSIHQAIPLRRWTLIIEEKQWSEIVLSQWDVSLSISVRCYDISLGLSLLFKKGKGIDSKLLSNGGPGLPIWRNGIILILLYYTVLFIHSWTLITKLDCKSMACMAVETHVGCCEDVVLSCLGALDKLPMHLVLHPPNSTLTDT